MSFRIIRDDITRVSADAIVNTANPYPTIGGGTDTAIYNKAGKDKLLAERSKIGEMSITEVHETPAFNLDAKYILHAVGPIWIDGKHNEETQLKDTYLNSLHLAEKLKCKSIAFPLMCSGSNGFPDGRALNIAMSTLQGYALESNLKITLVLFKTTVVELCGNVYNNIQQYVDDNYVYKANREEYSYDKERFEKEFGLIRDGQIKSNISKTVLSGRIEPKGLPSKPGTSKQKGKQPDIKKLLKNIDEKTFVDKIIEYAARSGKKDSEIYKPMEFSKQAYSKMMSNPNQKPRRNTAMLFCLSLELSYEESVDLMARAGYTFDVSDEKELFVEACIKNGFYDISKIEFTLEDNGYPTLIKY